MTEELKAAVRAFDQAIRSCADDPAKMASWCTAEGDDLDALYDRMVTLAGGPSADGPGSGAGARARIAVLETFGDLLLQALRIEDEAQQAWHDYGCGHPEWDRWKRATKARHELMGLLLDAIYHPERIEALLEEGQQ